MKNICWFDFDGTFADSMPTWRDKMFRLLTMQGITPPEGLLREIIPLGDRGTLSYYHEHFKLTMTDAEMLREMDAFALPKYRDEIQPKEGVIDYIRALRAGGTRVCLLTAGPHRMFEPCLKRVGAFDLFEKLWSAEDLGAVKSDPQIYLRAARELAVDISDVAFFDDNRFSLVAAKKAGAYTVGVYDASAAGAADVKAACDMYIGSFRELL